VVLVATIRALKMHGQVAYENLKEENVEAVQKGLANLGRHIEIIKQYNVPLVVALNRFTSDSEEEIQLVKNYCEMKGVSFEINESWAKGGQGATDLARTVVKLVDNKNDYQPLYSMDLTVQAKIEQIATRIYRAKGVQYSEKALNQLKELEALGLDRINVCVAKTQASLSDDPKKLGAPEDFGITVRELNISSGADFVVVIAGSIMTMPGLSKDPAAVHIDILENNEIIGLF
jgi:formate--tetrahydrofolate ligase